MAIQVPPNCDLTLGLICLDKSEQGISVWQMRVDERFSNPAGITQGGFLSAALDSAMGAAAVSAQAGRRVLVANAEMKTSFLRSVRPGDVLTCRAEVLKAGSQVCFVDGRMVNQRGDLVATATSTYIVRERTQ